MGTILASEIIGKAQILLQDVGKVNWPDDELLKWLNEGQCELVILKPDANMKVATVALIAGTKQAVPADCVTLVGVSRNMGAGSTPGAAVKVIGKDLMDKVLPGWHTATANAVVVYACTDAKTPKVFYVYPPQPVSPASVELVYCAYPAAIAATSNAITLDNIYEGPLIDYCLYRAYSKDAEYAGETGRAAAHYAKFLNLVMGKEQVETAIEP